MSEDGERQPGEGQPETGAIGTNQAGITETGQNGTAAETGQSGTDTMPQWPGLEDQPPVLPSNLAGSETPPPPPPPSTPAPVLAPTSPVTVQNDAGGNITDAERPVNSPVTIGNGEIVPINGTGKNGTNKNGAKRPVNPPVAVRDGEIVSGEGAKFHTGEWPDEDPEASARLAATDSVPGGETAWFAGGDRAAQDLANKETATVVADQSALDATAREVEKEADEFQRNFAGRVRIRTWLSVMALLGLTATGAFLTGKNWQELFPAPQTPLSARFIPDKEQVSTLEKELKDARAKIEKLLKQVENQAKLMAGDDELLEEIGDVLKHEVTIDGIPVAGCGEGHYCGINAGAMQDILRDEGWTLAQITPAGGGKGPTYLFHRKAKDGKTEFLRVYGWEISPLLKAEEATPDTTVSVRGERWTEQASVL